MYQYNTPWIKIRSQDHTSCSPTISELRQPAEQSVPQNTTLVQQDARTCESYAVPRVT